MASCLAIRKLVLGRFRSYLSARIDLDPRPVVIFGRNGAGKTNLLEAVSLLSPGRGLRRSAPEDFGHGASAVWHITATLDTPDGVHEVVIESQGAGRRVEIDGKAATQVALASLLRVLWLTPALDRLWLDAPAERRRYLDRVAMSLLPDHAEAALLFERSLRERNRMIRDEVRDHAWYAAIERGMAESGVRLVNGRQAAVARLVAAQDHRTFPAAALALETEVPKTVDAYADVLDHGRSRDFAAGRTLLGPHRDDLLATYAAKGIPARLCSTGEQKALILSLTLANARAVAAEYNAAPILLLDEVAAHLDPERRKDLFAAISEIGLQAWLTGTEPGLFTPLEQEAQWLEVREGEAGSRLESQRNQPAAAPVEGSMGSSPSEGGTDMTDKDNPEAVRPGSPGSGENICRKCEGTGKVDGEACPECGGSGKVTTPVGGA